MKNGGFTNAVNQGILWCGDMYKYIHLLNNDTEPFPDFLRILYDVMEREYVIGIASSARKLVTDSKQNIELFGADLIRGYQRMTNENEKLPDVIYTHWVPLCSAMIRTQMMREIGVLDKRMRTWCSDNDLCIRANFNGWNVALIPASRVLHIHQVTTGNTMGESGAGVIADQKILIEKMAGIKYAELMRELPLDCESDTWGKITFEVFKK